MNLELGVGCLDELGGECRLSGCSWVSVVWMNLVLSVVWMNLVVSVGCLDELDGECRLSG